MSIRVAPKAVCHQLLQRLDDNFKPLTKREEARILSALDNCPEIPHAADRLMAQMSRNTLSLILDKM